MKKILALLLIVATSALLVVALTSVILKISWYDRLSPGDGFLPDVSSK